MMANSLENMEKRHRGFHLRSLTGASDKEVAGPTHGANENRTSGVVTKFLA
jgi:hypothetical protein